MLFALGIYNNNLHDKQTNKHKHTHTHTHIYIHTYIHTYIHRSNEFPCLPNVKCDVDALVGFGQHQTGISSKCNMQQG